MSDILQNISLGIQSIFKNPWATVPGGGGGLFDGLGNTVKYGFYIVLGIIAIIGIVFIGGFLKSSVGSGGGGGGGGQPIILPI
jgi:hypothetical protein